MQSKAFHLSSMFVAAALLILPNYGRAEAVSFTRQGNTIQVAVGGKPLTTYHFDPATSKAYLQPLRDAKGVVITRSFPIENQIPAEHEHDRSLEPHQRGMYFGHGDVNGDSFWTEEAFAKYYGHSSPQKFGRMIFRKIDEMKDGPSSGVIRATFDLEGSDKKIFAQETQEYIFSGDKDSRVIDCKYVIRAGSAPIIFGDTKEGTFAIRLTTQLDAPAGVMVNSEGGKGESEVWGKRANWVNVDGVVDGQKLGVAVFDNPDSFRHQTYWHARGYGLLAANPFGLKYFLNDPKKDGSYTLPAGKSIRFHYRVVIHEGDYKDAGIAEKYKQYAAAH
jgi:hypothetical protein